MKLTFFLMFLPVFSALATDSYSQNTVISLDLKNTSIKEVLKEIEKSSEFFFLYNNDLLNVEKKVDICVKKEKIKDILNRLFEGQQVEYVLMNRQIILSPVNMIRTGEVFQQGIKGTVTDSNTGEPIPGVNIHIDGSKNGVISDVNGKYSIDVSDLNVTLVFSFIGYLTESIQAEGRTNIDVKLVPEIKTLDEVVVIGYGTVKRADLTGAVASVKGDELKAMPLSNTTQALQGHLLGVNVTSQDGRPGAAMSVKVRGGGSITQSNEPLYIVDGFPVGNINDISVSEIESIDVLKDAASTAIYGARGANGVILVTTKSGKEGKIKVSYDGYLKVGSVAKKYETLSAQEYVLDSWSYAASRGTANQDAVAKYFGLGSSYGNHYADYANVSTHNYTDDLLRNAISQSHSITISGGNKTTRVISSFGYLDENGIMRNSNFNRINGSFKLEQQLADKLKFDLDLHYIESNSLSGVESAAATAYTYRPIDNPLGGVNYSEVASGFSFGIQNIDDQHNPVKLNNDVTNKTLSKSLRGAGALSWEPVKGLIARSELGYTRGTSKYTYYTDGYTYNEKRATLNRGESQGFRSVSTLNYKFNLGKNNAFSALLGNEIIKNESESSQMDGRGYPSTFDLDKAIGLIQTATSSFSSSNTIGVPTQTISYFGRFNYTLSERYLYTATFRGDGSSKFGPNNRWGYFPAAAFGWRISEESFMQKTRNWLSNLKLRLSYGASGADNISSNLWHETWSSVSASNNHTPINGVLGPFYKPDGLLENPNLKWETTISRNIGIDYGFLDNRINGSIEIYWNTTKDLLMAVPVDNTSGYSYQFQNFGQTSNKGLELAINADVIKMKDFRFNLGIMYNYNHNNLDKLPNADQYLYSSYWASVSTIPTNDFMFEEGKPIGLVRGLKSEGFYKVEDFNYVNGQYVLKTGVPDVSTAITQTYKNPFSLPTGQNAFPGAVKFKDSDKNGKVDQDDAVALGEMIPSHTGSFQLNFTYKNIDLASNFTWAIGGQIYNADAMRNSSGEEFVGIGKQRTAMVADAYRIYNLDASGNLYAVTDPNELNALNANAKYPVPFHQSSITSSDWLEDASYLRLQTLSIGYTLPKAWLEKVKIKNARFYLTANNLFVITGYSGLDPEVNVTPTGQSGYFADLRIFPTPNMDNGAYPRARTFTFGVNITF